MDVDTLLTRQMELHTTTRRPPKTPEQLSQLRETLLEYSRFFKQLEELSSELKTNRIVIFQSFLHISMGGAVKFDKQKQSGEVPMHQAKVLARSSAIELEPVLRDHIPNAELMILVGLTKDLRTTLRVKVEDENDLKTVQKGIEDSVEYLNFIYSHSGKDIHKMFDFYMVEDGPSLLQMIDDADMASGDSLSPSMNSTLCGGLPKSMLVQEWHPKMDCPLPKDFLEVLQKQMSTVMDFKGHQASERVVVLENVLDWIMNMPDADINTVYEGILCETKTPLAKLCCDKRSSICRVTCDLIVVVARRLSSVEKTSAIHRKLQVLYEVVLGEWISSLLTGIYVTVSAISSATDHTIRELIILNHGPLIVVQKILNTLEQKKQTELRRKCLGYLALCVVAAEAYRSGFSSSFVHLLVPVAQNYVDFGDSPSRKMARSLCAILRGLVHCQLHVGQKVDQLILKEEVELKNHFKDPESLAHQLFEVSKLDSSISSFGSTTDFSAVLQRQTAAPGVVRGMMGCRDPWDKKPIQAGNREVKGRLRTFARKGNYLSQPKEEESSFLALASHQIVQKNSLGTAKSRSRSSSAQSRGNSQNRYSNERCSNKAMSRERKQQVETARDGGVDPKDYMFFSPVSDPSVTPDAYGLKGGGKQLDLAKPSQSLIRHLKRPQQEFLTANYLPEGDASPQIERVSRSPRTRVLSLEKKRSAS